MNLEALMTACSQIDDRLAEAEDLLEAGALDRVKKIMDLVIQTADWMCQEVAKISESRSQKQ
jgi:hypothetical protein